MSTWNKRFSLLLGLLLGAGSSAVAQEFNTHWIACPTADSTRQVWFRQTYRSIGRPTQATLSVKTTGLFELFVNERNVSTDVLTPYREDNTPTPITTEYDITRFLRPEHNTIAIWYAPLSGSNDRRQLSVVYSGTMPNGQRFAHTSDENWLCRPANRRLLPNGNEGVDNRSYPLKWNSEEIDAACWVGATAMPNTQPEQTTISRPPYKGYKVNLIRRQNYLDMEGDSILYEFGTAFKGWIRLTLRGTKPGERIYIGGMDYVCNGKLDEQAYQKFVLPEYRRVLVWGDKHFRREQIQEVEALEIVPYEHNPFHN
ncbi:MAG TPA: alpha-L-rhamnosidase N-terminal domain-containing protein [Prevotella sp.]